MGIGALSPWQLLLWIVLLEIASVPIIVLMANAITIAYFKAKEQHLNRMTKALSKAFESMVDIIVKRSESDSGSGDHNGNQTA